MAMGHGVEINRDKPKWAHQLPEEKQKELREWWATVKNDPDRIVIPIDGTEWLAKWIKEEVLGESYP